MIDCKEYGIVSVDELESTITAVETVYNDYSLLCDYVSHEIEISGDTERVNMLLSKIETYKSIRDTAKTDFANLLALKEVIKKFTD